MTRTLTIVRLRYLIEYGPVTGLFHWRVSRRGAAAGARAGSPHVDGGWRIMIDRQEYPAAVLAWFYVKGEWPKGEVDHNDLDRMNNRFGNLRDATISQNKANRRTMKNNSTGLKGVAFKNDVPRSRPWRAHIQVDGKRHYLGDFATPEEAHAAYAEAATRYFGEFARSA